MKPIYIFDLDGTLALIEHRLHYIQNGSKRWKEFFAACVDDEPNRPVVLTMNALEASGAEIWVWSGRSNEVWSQTLKWLDVHISSGISEIRMRNAGDHQPDVTLKMGWLGEMKPIDRYRLVAVFDDRDRLVKAYRDAGVTCFQVAPGDF